MASYLKPSQILKRTLELTHYEDLCRGLDPSDGMTANIERFISLAASIERQEPTPLLDFTDFIKELKKQSARISDPPAAGDSGNTVRCMSIHAAKGLEFPVVILPDLMRKARASGGAFLFSRQHGIGFKTKKPLTPFGERDESAHYTYIKQMEHEASEAESKRLLYVAMTRAKDLLVLPLHDAIEKEDGWHGWIKKI
jgi:ATP-dependent helicase/nuclease subunit A